MRNGGENIEKPIDSLWNIADQLNTIAALDFDAISLELSMLADITFNLSISFIAGRYHFFLHDLELFFLSFYRFDHVLHRVGRDEINIYIVSLAESVTPANS
jgi:hypothetical protein